ncbi:TPA: ATP-binding cassette domain-containing protein [Burkholderia aenigmatica]|uniref:ATP-binding cassette domain-containing protein n=1 Tax=Burkholderia sp. AU45251 TaxID=3059204 RepID=UPI002653DA4D|nr:ATP-binding cassette domain-containing protein [Burkholderia sp. AU45251]HDR9481983.1 ATP-binding cassette domain-containing protein [Burkholderia aenigmatica]MDN7515385.1 ATP-binding cassette domain-containing protein [Burkholderia sp. AU45251]HDR9515450.1 ATP-binding cassette domain-containing protein [Burkholderia aenigmatica]HDR9590354.1 ATP-binding cassette domain-containing protein [Burkholderia aenigmatica]HDR9598727.1 ATP-binding cassette domain-containing protein [Burkholderia aeni
MNLAHPLLEATDLVKRYGGLVATDNVSLTIGTGEIVGIVGPNGAGKSTLIGLLGGAVRADGGSVRLDGRDITALGATERARLGIGRTYQIPRPFLNVTVRENLLAARYSLYPFSTRRDAIEACDRILERTGLFDMADLPARQLPLLRRKRLEVARALALEPRLLLLDEVGAGLVDSEITELIDLIRSLRHEVQGMIIIEHVLRIVRECCQRLTVLNFGRKFAEGATQEVLTSDEVAAVYLGTAHGKGSADADGGHPEASPRPDDVACVGSVEQARSTPVLELRGIHAGYGQARVLNGIDLKVKNGEVIAVLGTNGAGKTTLANVISGIVRPTAGDIRIDGQVVNDHAPHRMAALGLSQCMEGRRIFGSLSVEENLMLAARNVPAQQIRERLESVYDIFPDLQARRSNSGTSMSGGQQQMLAIGRTLMARPRLIVFDEISLGLAPVMMDRLYLTLRKLKESGLTMLIVEQDVERALDLADQVHVMEHGRFALSGPTASIRHDPRLRHLYIGTAD